MNPQINFFNELIVDNFAGGGGASTGIELATGRVVNIAINHDPSAILMHKTNHPYTEHYQESVWDVDPVELCRGQSVGLAWFSPDCKHFSKAKGAALVDRNIRGLAWIVLKWAGTVKPRVIILENVEEFLTWGPVRKGKPVKAKAGQTFDKWLSQLKALGYAVEYRTLVAADYGTPTSRKRFFLVARCDGEPIVWPEPTHAPADDIRVKNGELKPYKTAADVIDWSLPCPSIFDSKQEIMDKHGLKAVRPLANNTMRRIARGLDKFVIKNSKPFIVTNTTGSVGSSIDSPVHTVTTTGNQLLVTPVMAQHKFNNAAQDIKQPLSTITAVGAHELITPTMVAIGQTGFSVDRSYQVTEPVKTVVSKAEQCVMTPTLIQYHSEQSGKEVRSYPMDKPLMTADGSNRFGLTLPYLTKYYGGDSGQTANSPLHTITSRDRENISACFLSKYFTGNDGAELNAPMPTVTAIDHNSLCMAHIAEFKGQDKGQAADAPLRTITAGDGEFGAIVATIIELTDFGKQQLYNWPKVREMLNTHCGYELKDNEIILFRIFGEYWFICDIGLRMLCPKELYAAMGFPSDYVIDRDYLGNEYKRAAQVARCGNAVCPQIARALVKANLPEMCVGVNINLMKELHDSVAV